MKSQIEGADSSPERPPSPFFTASASPVDGADDTAEEQGGERLVLSDCPRDAIHSEAGEVGLEVGGTHLWGMPAPVEAYESADPADVGLLGPQTIVFRSEPLPCHLEQRRLRRRRRTTGTIRWINHDASLRNSGL